MPFYEPRPSTARRSAAELAPPGRGFLAAVGRAATAGGRSGLPGARRAVLSRSDRRVGRAALLPDPDRRAGLDSCPSCGRFGPRGWCVTPAGAEPAGGRGRAGSSTSRRPVGDGGVVAGRSRPWREPGRARPGPNVDASSRRRGRLRGLGATPPGLVLAAPDSPMLAGAVALAAGHFQPLVRLEPPARRRASRAIRAVRRISATC